MTRNPENQKDWLNEIDKSGETDKPYKSSETGETDEAQEEKEKTEGQRLADRLRYSAKNSWDSADAKEREQIFDFAESYKSFLDRAKTEREFVDACVTDLEAAGYYNLDDCLSAGKTLSAGMKVYQNIKGKSLILAVIGTDRVSDGVNILGAHVDSPRLDLKTNPLYEDEAYAMLDTQYYGGIKKYQWVTIPLALHGVIMKANGDKITVRIGEEESDPVFVITDLLPHLAAKQMEKKATEVVSGEGLNVLAGSIPYPDEAVGERVKLAFLKLLNDKYGVVEEDFSAAELEIVPAFRAKDVGLDRSMIGAYGHDDRCCSYAAVRAVMEIGKSSAPQRTAVCLLTDKEEIGSVGNTGAESRLFENFIACLCAASDGQYGDIMMRQSLAHSHMLSIDVKLAIDPNFPEVHDKKTSAHLGNGVVLTKYTGGNGKGGGSDANAEFVNKIRTIFNRHNIQWQHGGRGIVDVGGGGTIAKYIANLGTEVLDVGIPILSMHAPFEVISKIDLYTAYQGYMAFLQNA